MKTKHFTTIAIAAVLLAGLARPVLADGVIIPDPPPGPGPVPLIETWLTILYHRVTVTIEDQVAVTHVEQEFLNEYDWEAEGTYVFPLPEGAAISEFAMWVDGTRVEGDILEADEARAIYEEIVRQRRDPALLEYVGRAAVQARIFPIPPGDTRKIEIEYSEVLPVENGLVRYCYPLNTEKFSARPLQEVSVRVEIESNDAMHAVYSPTHQDDVYIERDGDHEALVGYEEQDVLPDRDFELIYTVSQEDVGLNLLTYRESRDEDGFFLLLVAPTVEVDEDAVVPRDVILVLDTSGSMDGEKLEQAKEALAYVLEHLNREDRFNVIAFSTGIQRYARALRPASEADEAVEWVEYLEALGGTDINRALLEALDLVDEHPAIVIFLTDGLPTEGVTEIEDILDSVGDAAPDEARLFPFGVGDDVNTLLLDTLAEQLGGTTGYVRPHERIDEEISAFYAKVSTPVLTNVELDFDDVLVEDLYPDPLPDLFAGTQLILTGRYRQGGATRIELTGRVDGERTEFVYEGSFRSRGGDEFIPRLWATRKIGHLLTQIRLHGERREWVDAVVDLSIRYGIITPYTSFLIEEDDILTEAGREEVEEQYMLAPEEPAVGAPAAERADLEGGLRSADSAGGEAMPEEAAEVLRLVGTKTFLLQDGVWIDTGFDPSQMTTTRVGFGSDEYFHLLAARPEWGAYLALGKRVIFIGDGTAYEVAEGDGGPVEIPAPHTDEPDEPAGERDEDDRDKDDGEASSSRTSGGPCAGAMVMGLVTGSAVLGRVPRPWRRRRVNSARR